MARRLLRPLTRTLETLRRDLDAATAGLRGVAPAPFQARDGRGWPDPAPRYWLQDAGRPLHHVLISVGPGIDVHAAMAAAVLERRPLDRATVIHGDRDLDSSALPGALLAATGPRLSVHHVVARPPPEWNGPSGLLDADALQRLLAAQGIFDGVAARWYLCGPAGDIDPLVAWLPRWQVDPARVRVERLDGEAPPAGALDRAWTVTLRTAGGPRQVNVPPGHSILEAARAAGLDPPASCTMGGCGACRQRVLSGQVHLPPRTCLTATERASGFTLLCVGRPMGPVTVEAL